MMSRPVILMFVLGAALVGADEVKAIGSKQCKECHEAVHAHEAETKHWKMFKEFVKAGSAGAEMAKKVGYEKALAPDTRCVACHGTVWLNQQGAPKVEPLSCEQCHGGAADWLAAHNVKYDAAKHGADPAAFLVKRRAECMSKGMTAQWTLNGGYRNCVRCHIGTPEDIVNEGGHTVMKTFELLAYSQGSVRHWRGDKFVADPPPRLAAIHIAGQAMIAERAVQVLAESKAVGTARTEHLAIAKAAAKRLGELAALVAGHAELSAVATAAAAIDGWTAEALDAAKAAELAKDLAVKVIALNDKLDATPPADDLAAKVIPANLPTDK